MGKHLNPLEKEFLVKKYKSILIGGAVGFGFTIVEEYVYTSGISTLILRVATVTVHMLLGFAMGRHLGLARYNKVTGKGSVWKEYLLAFLVPVADGRCGIGTHACTSGLCI